MFFTHPLFDIFDIFDTFDIFDIFDKHDIFDIFDILDIFQIFDHLDHLNFSLRAGRDCHQASLTNEQLNKKPGNYRAFPDF